MSLFHHVAASFWLHDVWHPLIGRGYQFWSGVESALERPLGWFALALVYYRHHNCRAKRCPWLGHAHPEHGQPVCQRHFHSPLVAVLKSSEGRG